MRYECRLVGRTGWAPCASPRTYANLPDGTYTFEVHGRQVIGDFSGEVTATARRTFTVNTAGQAPAAAGTEAAPQQSQAPGVTVVDRATGQPLTIRIADIDRRVDLDELQAAGVQVTVIPPRGAKQIRFRIFRNTGGQNGRAAGAGAVKALATEYRKVAGKKGKVAVTLRSKAIRRLKPGRYVLEVTSMDAKGKLGKPKKVTFTVLR